MLSDLELTIMRRAVTGLTYPEIAKELDISLSSVKNATSRIFQKLQARNMSHAIVIAYQIGLIS